MKALSWWQTFQSAYINKSALSLLLLGIAAGIPLALIFGTLSLWLREAGIERSTVTMFGWAALGYSFKFVWAPLMDTLSLPLLTKKLGRRRGWLFLTQCLIVLAILGMASIDPATGSLGLLAFMAVMLGFSSASQDIVIDAYRIECAHSNMQSALSASYVAGYRIGMIISGAGALFLASHFGSHEDSYHYSAWQMTYMAMAGSMLIGILTTLTIKEPDQRIVNKSSKHSRLVLVFILSVIGFVLGFWGMGVVMPIKSLSEQAGQLVGFLLEVLRFLVAVVFFGGFAWASTKVGIVSKQQAFDTWGGPLQDFFKRYGKKALLLLLLIGFYRVSDIVAGVISNVFYQDLGFSKEQIGVVVKTYGLFATIFGGFAGGLIAQKMSILKAMTLGAILASTTNLLFVWLSQNPSMPMLYAAVAFDNLAAGFASAIFIAFLSALTSIRFTAVQYAIFSSLMTLFPKFLGGYSGMIVDANGYPAFFIMTFLIGLPVLLLIALVKKHIDLNHAAD